MSDAPETPDPSPCGGPTAGRAPGAPIRRRW